MRTEAAPIPYDTGEVYGYVLVGRNESVRPEGRLPFRERVFPWHSPTVYPTLEDARADRNKVGADRLAIAVIREVIVE